MFVKFKFFMRQAPVIVRYFSFYAGSVPLFVFSSRSLSLLQFASQFFSFSMLSSIDRAMKFSFSITSQLIFEFIWTSLFSVQCDILVHICVHHFLSLSFDLSHQHLISTILRQQYGFVQCENWVYLLVYFSWWSFTFPDTCNKYRIVHISQFAHFIQSIE